MTARWRNEWKPGVGVGEHRAEPPRIAVATRDALDKISLREALRGATGFNEKADAGLGWLESTRLMRANRRIMLTRANLLAGGVAYSALFSLFAMLTLGITIVMVTLSRNPTLRDEVIKSTAKVVPGFLDLGDGGLITPESLMLDTALNPTTIISAIVALWAARIMVMSLRRAMRSVAGLSSVRELFHIQFGRDVAAMAILGLSVLVTTALVLAFQTFGADLLALMEIDTASAGVLIVVSAYLITFGVDLLVFMYLFWFLAGIRPPRRDLWLGVTLGALAAGILRALGTAVILIPSNPVMASATAVVTLLLLVNIAVRMVLYVTAIMINPPAPVVPQVHEEMRFKSRPNYVTVSVPQTLEWDHDPTVGTLIPDATLHPDFVPPQPPTPKWGGVIGRMKRHRLERLERKAQAARDAYYT